MDDILNRLLTPEGISGLVATLFWISKEVKKLLNRKSKVESLAKENASLKDELKQLKEKNELPIDQ